MENDWINYISKMKILSPFSDLFKMGKIMNKEFQDYIMDPWIFKTVTDKVKKNEKYNNPTQDSV